MVNLGRCYAAALLRMRHTLVGLVGVRVSANRRLAVGGVDVKGALEQLAACPRGVVRAAGVLALVFAAAALLPGRASAHAGVTAPAATSFLARLGSVPAGLDARIVDGDQRLWLRASPRLTAYVLGFEGEAYLRFSPEGVAVNVHSPAYYLNRLRPLTPPAGLTPGTRPVWKQVSTGHTYEWHEDRLHALAAAARAPGAAYVGRWTVPVLVGGTMTRISGTLWHADDPSLVWFWPIAVLLGCLAALLRLREPRLEAATGAVLAGVTLVAATIGRLGRELYGRPTVSAGQMLLVAVTCAVAVGLVVLYLRREWRALACAVIAVLGIVQGLALVGTLLHGFVLSVLPAWLERAAAATSLAAGAGLLVIVVAGATPTAASETRARPVPQARSRRSISRSRLNNRA
jgi:hypothetical protein